MAAYNDDLTSRETGSVGVQTDKNMTIVRTANVDRIRRTAPGNVTRLTCLATISA